MYCFIVLRIIGASYEDFYLQLVDDFSRILLSSIDELQQQFDDEVPESAKTSAKYSQNLLEYFCFRALAVATGVTDYLSSKEFHVWDDAGMGKPGGITQTCNKSEWCSSLEVKFWEI